MLVMDLFITHCDSWELEAMNQEYSQNPKFLLKGVTVNGTKNDTHLVGFQSETLDAVEGGRFPGA